MRIKKYWVIALIVGFFVVGTVLATSQLNKGALGRIKNPPRPRPPSSREELREKLRPRQDAKNIIDKLIAHKKPGNNRCPHETVSIQSYVPSESHLDPAARRACCANRNACATAEGTCISQELVYNTSYICNSNNWRRCGAKESDANDVFYSESIGDFRCTVAGLMSTAEDITGKISHSSGMREFINNNAVNFFQIELNKSLYNIDNSGSEISSNKIRLRSQNERIYTSFLNDNSVVAEIEGLPRSDELHFEVGDYQIDDHRYRGVWIRVPDDHILRLKYNRTNSLPYISQWWRRDLFINFDRQQDLYFALGTRGTSHMINVNFETPIWIKLQSIYLPSVGRRPMVVDVLVDTNSHAGVDNAMVRSVMASAQEIFKENANIELNLRHIFYEAFPGQFRHQPTSLYENIFEDIEGGLPEMLVAFGPVADNEQEAAENSIIAMSGRMSWEGVCSRIPTIFPEYTIHYPTINLHAISPNPIPMGELNPDGYQFGYALFHELLHNFENNENHTNDPICLEKIARENERDRHYHQFVSEHYSFGVCSLAYKRLVEAPLIQCLDRPVRRGRLLEVLMHTQPDTISEFQFSVPELSLFEIK